jgi:rRNA-processing protein FCF1
LELEQLFHSAQIIIPFRVIDEIEHLSGNKERKLKERELASLALQIINKNREKIEIPKLEGRVDDSIVSYALNNPETVVASLDREIRKKLKNSKLLTIRQRKRLALV